MGDPQRIQALISAMERRHGVAHGRDMAGQGLAVSMARTR
ncbi:hypothetical protein AKJ09_08774 [Labilithrix luteola]|uniref:Uncharacterized protein n=1 Tax=Labilithrix luteola TaxID=1391654 RepID=A0A0K1Q8H6_9BACT|nr:hypothetical protein AKJ09_08774 [Labilithrix luteola]